MVLKFDMKIPGSQFNVTQVPMEFTYDKLGDLGNLDGYSRLLEEALKGDNTLFTRSDAVEASWRYFAPVLEYLDSQSGLPLQGYPAGSWGPLESEAIIDNGHKWTNPCKNLTNTNIYCEL
jgi:glucose-6-phosphate 1-dehydrogenase